MAGNILIDPLGFMRQNLVIPSADHIGKTADSAGIVMMTLRPYPSCAKRHGQDIPRYALMRYQGQANALAAFNAFWCPYNQNETLSCKLDDSANLMFTATMDGCTFGIGAQDGHGGCTVAHANEGTFGAKRENTFGMDGARKFQRDEQLNRLKYKIGGDFDAIEPTAYMADHDGELVLKSTTFGVRTGGNWQFYTQTYLNHGGIYYLRDVTRRI